MTMWQIRTVRVGNPFAQSDVYTQPVEIDGRQGGDLAIAERLARGTWQTPTRTT